MVDLWAENSTAWTVVELMLVLGPEAGMAAAIAQLGGDQVGEVAEAVKAAWGEYNAFIERNRPKPGDR